MKQRLRQFVSAIVNARSRFESHQGGRVVSGRDVEGLHLVRFEGRNAIGRGTIFGGSDVRIGYATTIGANNFIHGPVAVGNYCQLGPAIGIYGKDHPISHATTYVNKNLFQGRLNSHSKEILVKVGHDVWIGHGAVILKGVEIGNGAVIGAGSVVTCSIPDYAIAVGNPARVLRFRFKPHIIELLQQLEWWLMPEQELMPLESLFHIDFNQEEERGISLLREALNKRLICARENLGTASPP